MRMSHYIQGFLGIVIAPLFGQEFCCDGGFSIERAVQLGRASESGPTAGGFSIRLLTDRHADSKAGRPGLSEVTAEQRMAEYLSQVNSSHRFALYLRTQHGEAIDVWLGGNRSFERRVLRGSNPFLLGDGSEIVFIAKTASGLSVYCRTRAPGTVEWATVALTELANVLGIDGRVNQPLSLIWGDNPWFFGDGDWSFPSFLPSMGWSYPPASRFEPPKFRCSMAGIGRQISCWTGRVTSTLH
jgi:hypothetical protein